MKIIPNVAFRVETALQTFIIEKVYPLSTNEMVGYRITTRKPKSSYLAFFSFVETNLRSKIKEGLIIKIIKWR